MQPDYAQYQVKYYSIQLFQFGQVFEASSLIEREIVRCVKQLIKCKELLSCQFHEYRKISSDLLETNNANKVGAVQASSHSAKQS